MNAVERNEARELAAGLDRLVARLDVIDDLLGDMDKTIRERRESLPSCVECGRPWLDNRERWRTYLTVDDEAALYCPDCGAPEFS